MAVVGSNLEQASQESDITLKRTPAVESSRPPASLDTPRASSVASSVPSSVRSTPTARKREKPTKYVSQMAKAREEKKKKRAAAFESSSNSDRSSLSDLETSSNPSTVTSGTSSSDTYKDKLSNLPKFGEWAKHSANSGPCYTLLFQNAAQEKKLGGPIRVHAPLPSVQNEDLYGYNPAASVKKPPRKKKSRGLLCCFTSSQSS